MIATACSGGTISASMGVATMPMPTKPPLARPSSVTAITAMVQNRGSEGRVKGGLVLRRIKLPPIAPPLMLFANGAPAWGLFSGLRAASACNETGLAHNAGKSDRILRSSALPSASG